MTEMDVFIDLSDIVLSKAPYVGYFQLRDYLVSVDIEKYKGYITDANAELLRMNRFDIILDYMSKEGYVTIFGSQGAAFLTDHGKDVKRKNGIANYKTFIEDRDNAVFETNKWAKKSALASEKAATANEKSTSYNKTTMILIAVYTGITFLLFIVAVFTCNYTKRTQSSQAITPNSTTEIQARKDTDKVK